MTGSVDITGIGDKILTGSAIVKLKAEHIMSGSLVYEMSIGSKDLNSSVTVIQKGTKDLSCSVKIRPENRMICSVEVVQPPIKRLKTSIIKDSGVYKDYHHINFGEVNTITLGSEDNKYFVLVETDIITQDEIDHLVEAKLNLKMPIPLQNESLIKIYKTDSSWNEYGINYDNMPTDLSLISETLVDVGSQEISIDLFDYVLNNIKVDEVNNFNFVIESNTKLTIGSRENTSIAPEFILGAKFYPDSLGLKKIPGSITVVQNNSKNIPGKVFLTGGLFNEYLNGSVSIIKYDRTKDLSCSVTVIRKDLSLLSGSVGIIRHDENKDLLSSVTVVQKDSLYLKGSIDLKKVSESNDIPSSVIVVQSDSKDIKGSLLLSLTENDKLLSGSIVVKQSAEATIPCSLYILNSGNKDLSGSIDLKETKASYLNGSIKIKESFNEGFNGSLSIKQYEDKNDLSCSVNIRETISKNISGSVKVIEPIYEADKDIPCSIKILGCSCLDVGGTVEIKQEESSLLLPCSIDVRAVESEGFMSSVTVIQTANKDLNSSVFVRQVWAKDIKCSVNITDKKNMYYAYIF